MSDFTFTVKILTFAQEYVFLDGRCRFVTMQELSMTLGERASRPDHAKTRPSQMRPPPGRQPVRPRRYFERDRARASDASARCPR